MKSLRQINPWVPTCFSVVGLVLMAVLRSKQLLSGDFSSWAELSGWLLLVTGFWLSNGFDDRFDAMVERLFRRELISGADQTRDEFKRGIVSTSNHLALLGVILFPSVLLMLHVLNWEVDQEDLPPTLLKLLFEAIAAGFVGIIAGRIVSYGLFGFQLKRHRASILVQPGHPDRAGGLKFVGDFYLYQAGLVMIPLSFFAFWFAVMSSGMASSETSPSAVAVSSGDALLIEVSVPLGSSSLSNIKKLENEGILSPAEEQAEVNRIWSEEWAGRFSLLFLAMFCIEVVAFFLPMNFFHEEMVRNAEEAQQRADEIGNEIIRLNEGIATLSSQAEREELIGKRNQLAEDFSVLESCPRWPVDSGVRRRFTIGNAAIMVFPIVAKIPFVEQFIHGVIGS